MSERPAFLRFLWKPGEAGARGFLDSRERIPAHEASLFLRAMRRRLPVKLELLRSDNDVESGGGPRRRGSDRSGQIN